MENQDRRICIFYFLFNFKLLAFCLFVLLSQQKETKAAEPRFYGTTRFVVLSAPLSFVRYKSPFVRSPDEPIACA